LARRGWRPTVGHCSAPVAYGLPFPVGDLAADRRQRNGRALLRRFLLVPCLVTPNSLIPDQLPPIEIPKTKDRLPMTFPPCHSRRDLDGEAHIAYCGHPRMNIRDQRVNVEVCEICTLRREPPPDAYRPFPPPAPRGQCRYLGDQIGLRDCPGCPGNVRLKAFACNHPAHVETTIQECLVCQDHEEASAGRKPPSDEDTDHRPMTSE